MLALSHRCLASFTSFLKQEKSWKDNQHNSLHSLANDNLKLKFELELKAIPI